MQVISKKFAAWSAVAALGAGSLVFAAETQTPRHHFHRGGALMQVLNDSQKAQAKTVFEQARETAKPIREQMKANRKSLQAAVQAGNTSQIQALSKVEGSEIGQLMAIRSSAYSKVYQTLSADQKQKLSELQQAQREAWRARHQAVTKSAN